MMAKSPHYKGNNKGGYGNPPVKHQFKGKPGPGRPKGSRSIDGALKKVFGKKIARIDRAGNRSFLGAPDALAERMLELGLKGSLGANVEARRLAEKFGPQEPALEADLSRLNDLELELYGYISMVATGRIESGSISHRHQKVFERFGEVLKEFEEDTEAEYDVQSQPPGSE